MAANETIESNDRLELFNILADDEYATFAKNEDIYDNIENKNIFVKVGKFTLGVNIFSNGKELTQLIDPDNYENVIAIKFMDCIIDAWKTFYQIMFDLKIIQNVNDNTIYDVQILTFKHKEARDLVWLAGAQILNQALDEMYEFETCSNLGINYENVMETGNFYCDIVNPYENRKLMAFDITEIVKICNSIIKKGYEYSIINISKENALMLFESNPQKHAMINDSDREIFSIYKCDNHVNIRDINYGNIYISSTKILQTIIITNTEVMKDNMLRIYGMSFTDEKYFKIYLRNKETMERRDHRIIGIRQKLFCFNTYAPGSCFFLPHGTRIYNKLIQFMRKKYKENGFDEVRTPDIYNNDLWKVSNHWDKYKSNIVTINNNHSLKPMNCPGHCLIFKSIPRLCENLPIRISDFGSLHRNEYSHTTNNLLQINNFSQDDAHIFCSYRQANSELRKCVHFLEEIYKIFGFEYEFALSTRPVDFIGDVTIWDAAETGLTKILNGKKWSKDEGKGAFYGPKIDVHIKDGMGKKHQCGSIQVDFNLPTKFNLKFINEEKEFEQPIIIHRVVFGSIEKFIGLLTEHYEGKWPFWLSPRQAIIIPVSKVFNEYAMKVKEMLGHDYYVDINLTDSEVAKKIKRAQEEQYNYILVIGKSEMTNNTVIMKYRDLPKKEEVTIDELLVEFSSNEKNYN